MRRRRRRMRQPKEEARDKEATDATKDKFSASTIPHLLARMRQQINGRML